MQTRYPADSDTAWAWLLEAAGRGESGSPPVATDADGATMLELYLPVLASRCIGHLAQSLDGRIALPDGQSHWISGREDIVHTHRLRALCDAVVVGAETVLHDDPKLTVREVPGAHPVRVVLDPRGRVPRSRRIFSQAGSTLVIGPDGDVDLGSEISPESLLEELASRGLRRVFVEGGGVTVSRFIRAGVMDRLHLAIAPVLLGRGRPSLQLDLGSLGECPRPTVRRFPMGNDTLFDLDLR